MNRDFKMPFSNRTMRSIVASILLLLVAELSNFVLADYDETWPIPPYEYSGSIVVPVGLPSGVEVGIPVYVTAAGTVKVTSPAGTTYEVDIADIHMSADGFSDVFALSEIGDYQIEETYILTFSRLDSDTQAYVTEDYDGSHVWPLYFNAAPSIALFQLEDMYIDNYVPYMVPNDALRIVDVTPSPCRPSGKLTVKIVTLRDIVENEHINISASFSAEWHKTSSLTPTTDDEAPTVSHNKVSPIQAGSAITATVTDNLKVDSVVLNFRDSSGSSSRIDMTLTDQPDIYAGYIPVTASAGWALYYFQARDVAGNETRFPLSGSFNASVESIDFGDIDGNGAVANNDAMLALQSAVGLLEFTPDQHILGDVSGNTTISSYDAGLIFEYVDGIRTTFPVESDTSTPGGIGIASAMGISVPYLTGQAGDDITVPININNTTGGIIGVDLTLTYNPNVLTAMNDVTVGGTASGWNIAWNATDGQIIVGMADSSKLTGEGSLMNIRFRVSGSASSGQTSPLTLSGVSLNEGGVSADTVNGLFTVVVNFGDIDGDGTVADNDAMSALQSAVGLLEFTPDQHILGDVSGDTTISSYDAGLIFRYVNGDIITFPVESGGSSLGGIGTASAMEMSVPHITGQAGDDITVPININNTAGGIFGVDLTLTYDPDVLTAMDDVTVGGTASGWSIVWNNITDDQIIIGMADSSELFGGGSLVNISFRVSGSASSGQTSPLTLSGVSLNEGGVSAGIVNGLFTVVEEKAVHLYPGWNLISICLDTGDTDPLSVLESIEGRYSSVWTYSEGNWQRYIYGGLDSLNDLKTIVPGKGYWIDMDVEATLTITGVQIIADDDRAIRLSQGWNLAGYNSLNSQLRSNAQLPPEYTSIWTYNNSITDGTWLGHVIGADFFNDLDQLEVGRGHWIYVLANCFWVIPR